MLLDRRMLLKVLKMLSKDNKILLMELIIGFMESEIELQVNLIELKEI
jgi:hypothetical protein